MSNAAEKIAPRQEVTTAQQNTPATSEATAIIAMIERAATNPAVDIDKMERLMKMHTAMLERNARAAFDVALAALQPDLPIIDERGQIKVGTEVRSTYAKWADINEAIRPILHRHGFVLTHRVKQENSKLSVTGILAGHGHREETTLELPIDTSGSKNNVQAIGSSTMYGQRYTARLLLNITSRAKEDRDDDGKAAGGKFVTEDQVIQIRDLIEAKGADQPKFLKFFKIEKLADLPAARHAEAVNMLNAKTKARG